MPPSDIEVRYADESLLVLEKPAGLLSVPGRGEDKQDCLSARALRLFPDALVVHRLDMATSGLMLMARGSVAQRRLNDAFANRTVFKRYTAVIDGFPDTSPEIWNLIDLPIVVDWPNRPRRVIDPVLGKPSQTRWRLMSHDQRSNTSRVELEPVTGRSHQLRVHLLAMGHAILGDALYAPPHALSLSRRLLLHASFLELNHPIDDQPLQFTSEPAF
ncbi:RluA family pseudouridine synthase [Rhodoferax sp. PAMC 29310]|uniref:RluA family pseudouridine synthase n=1 Tax=Rhodoferax sp. PAMC 29310 TaxID=2822760 RepID=UPI001B31DF50|nr:pseudouridine synthase [Rhodoferax sp. PAMC 29310]